MDNSDRLLAINDNEIGELSVNLMDYSDELGDLFSDIDSKMEELAEYFGGSAANDLFAQYKAFKNNYPTIRDNIISYSDDLITLITRFHDGDKEISVQVEKATDEVLQQTKMIEEL